MLGSAGASLNAPRSPSKGRNFSSIFLLIFGRDPLPDDLCLILPLQQVRLYVSIYFTMSNVTLRRHIRRFTTSGAISLSDGAFLPRQRPVVGGGFRGGLRRLWCRDVPVFLVLTAFLRDLAIAIAYST